MVHQGYSIRTALAQLEVFSGVLRPRLGSPLECDRLLVVHIESRIAHSCLSGAEPLEYLVVCHVDVLAGGFCGQAMGIRFPRALWQFQRALQPLRALPWLLHHCGDFVESIP